MYYKSKKYYIVKQINHTLSIIFNLENCQYVYIDNSVVFMCTL